MIDFDLLKDLIRLRPVSDDVAAVNLAVDRVMNEMVSAGLFCKLEMLGDRKILYAATTEETPDVLFNAHLDVVDGEDFQFEAVEKDGWLYGRGSADCLGSSVLLACLLKRCKGKANIGVIFSTDEEIGGATTEAMAKRGYAAKKMVVVLDGGDYGTIITAQKGTAVMRLRAYGKEGHSAYPWRSENAIDKIVYAYGKIRERWKENDGEGWTESMVPCIVSGGAATNKVAGYAELKINLRYVEKGILPKRVQELQEMTGLEVEVISNCDVMESRRDAPELQILKKNVEKELGRECIFTTVCGATDARFFGELGIPVVIMNPDCADEHGPGESVRMDSMITLEEILARSVEEVSC